MDKSVMLKRFFHIVDKCNDWIGIKEKRNMWILGILYKIILDLYYAFVVCIFWAGDGLTYNPSLINHLSTWVLYVFGYFMILQVKDNFIAVFLHVQWILSIAPVLVFCAAQKDKSIIYGLAIILVLVVQVVFSRKKKYVAISFGKGKLSNYVTIGLCIVVAVVWGIMALYNDFAGLKAFDFEYIYEMRSRLVFPPMFQYLVSWVTKAIIPWLFIIGLHKKNFFLVIYSVVFQILYFMLIGYKIIFLLMGVIFLAYFLGRWGMIKWGMYAGLTSVTLMGTLGGIIDRALHTRISVSVNALLGERTLFYPAMIKYQFYEFFSQYPNSVFADGLIGKLLSLTDLYKKRLGHIVYAYSRDGIFKSESNTGYLADSYAQAGIIGMLLIGILVIFVVRFFANYKDYIPTEILCSVLVCFAVILNDGAFFTSFLTGGIWLYMVFVIIYARCDVEEKFSV